MSGPAPARPGRDGVRRRRSPFVPRTAGRTGRLPDPARRRRQRSQAGAREKTSPKFPAKGKEARGKKARRMKAPRKGGGGKEKGQGKTKSRAREQKTQKRQRKEP